MAKTDKDKDKEAVQERYVNEPTVIDRETLPLSFGLTYARYANTEDLYRIREEVKQALKCGEAPRYKAETGEDGYKLVKAVLSGKVLNTEEAKWEFLDGVKRGVRDFLTGKAEIFFNVREPRIKEQLLPYIEKNILLQWANGIGVWLWGRASNYGLSYDWERAFYYHSLDSLSKEDREVLKQLASDVYEIALDELDTYRTDTAYNPDRLDVRKDEYELCLKFWSSLLDDDGHEWESFKEYPFETPTIEEYRKRDKEAPEGEEELEKYLGWPYDVIFNLSHVLNRLDKAIYLAFQYSGEEYLDFLKSLNVEEDWDRSAQGTEINNYKETIKNLEQC